MNTLVSLCISRWSDAKRQLNDRRGYMPLREMLKGWLAFTGDVSICAMLVKKGWTKEVVELNYSVRKIVAPAAI